MTRERGFKKKLYVLTPRGNAHASARSRPVVRLCSCPLPPSTNPKTPDIVSSTRHLQFCSEHRIHKQPTTHSKQTWTTGTQAWSRASTIASRATTGRLRASMVSFALLLLHPSSHNEHHQPLRSCLPSPWAWQSTRHAYEACPAGDSSSTLCC